MHLSSNGLGQRVFIPQIVSSILRRCTRSGSYTVSGSGVDCKSTGSIPRVVRLHHFRPQIHILKVSMNTKQVGNIGLAHAILYFTNKGYPVSLPINDSQKYDLVVDIDSILFSVEVKTTKQYSASNIPVVTVKSSGGTAGTMYATVATSGADYLFIHHLTENKNWLIPVTENLPVYNLNLGDKYRHFEVY